MSKYWLRAKLIWRWSVDDENVVTVTVKSPSLSLYRKLHHALAWSQGWRGGCANWQETMTTNMDQQWLRDQLPTMFLPAPILQTTRRRRSRRRRVRQGLAQTSTCGSLSRSCCCSPPSTATTSTGSTGRKASSRSLTRSRWPPCGERERWVERELFFYLNVFPPRTDQRWTMTSFPGLCDNTTRRGSWRRRREVRGWSTSSATHTTSRSDL